MCLFQASDHPTTPSNSEPSFHGTRPEDADQGEQGAHPVILSCSLFGLNPLPPPRKFTELREKDFQHYEMEKRFVEEQRLRHIKDEERRKAEQEKMEAAKASQANRKVLIDPLPR